MYVARHLAPVVERALGEFPAVLVTGPRQSGKTTLLKHLLGERARVVNLDDPVQRELAVEDPAALLDVDDRPLLIDEVQYLPELLHHVKLRIDADRDRTGRFALTGSQQLELMRGVTESLAGRVAVLDLLPFSESELPQRRSLEEVVYVGGFPEPALHPGRRDLWVRSYLRTYVQRDVRDLRAVSDLRAFEQFISLCAARHGQELNLSSLAGEVGVTHPTAKAWIGVLEASYVLTVVPAFHRNFGKRVVKRPKLYFADPALVCELTRVSDGRSALAGPLGGPLLEGWVVNEAVRQFTNRGRRPDVFHWRSRSRVEVDVVVGVGPKVLPIEVKSTASPRSGHAEALRRFAEFAGDEALPGVLVCRVSEPTPLPGGVTALPWAEFPDWLGGRLQ